jgi:hypothetical protein
MNDEKWDGSIRGELLDIVSVNPIRRNRKVHSRRAEVGRRSKCRKETTNVHFPDTAAQSFQVHQQRLSTDKSTFEWYRIC